MDFLHGHDFFGTVVLHPVADTRSSTADLSFNTVFFVELVCPALLHYSSMSNIKPSLCNVNCLLPFIAHSLPFIAPFPPLPHSHPSYDIQSPGANCLFRVFLFEWIVVDFAQINLRSYSHRD